jgi:hypothetical protein
LNVLSDIEVCEQDVIDIISTLNVDKAVGHDIISNRMLLAVKNEIAKPMSLLFNRSIQEMVFPAFKHLQSKSGKTLFSSFELDMEEKYLFKISAFSMDSYDNLKSFCGSERGGVSLDEFSFLMNVDKAVGHDIISNRMLLAVKNEIAKPMSLLFNRSIQEMVFPDQWKIAHVIALFKKGDKSRQKSRLEFI